MSSTLKTCFKCEQQKARSEFYRHSEMADGLLSKCKECARADVTKNRAKNREYYRWYDRVRAVEPKRVAAREAYRKTKASREIARKKRAEWAARNTEKVRAHRIVQRAVRSGVLVRQPCAECGSENSQAHHDDYSKPLEVKWLCSKHHGKRHRSERWFGTETPPSGVAL